MESEFDSAMYDFSILRELRQREGLSIAEVSERSAVSSAVISKLERNRTLPGLNTLYRVGRVVGLNPSELLRLAEKRSAHRLTTDRPPWAEQSAAPANQLGVSRPLRACQ